MVNIDTSTQLISDCYKRKHGYWTYNWGCRPAIRAKEAKDNRIRINLRREPFVCWEWFKDKVKNSNRNPTCNPETDKICMAPHIGNLVRYRVKDLVFAPKLKLRLHLTLLWKLFFSKFWIIVVRNWRHNTRCLLNMVLMLIWSMSAYSWA
jgi:hypothetical protein